jgi:hypothetical protein
MAHSSGGQTWEGKGPDFKAATEKAWEKAKQSPGPESFRVVNIFVSGDNPIREYKVVLGR